MNTAPATSPELESGAPEGPAAPTARGVSNAVLYGVLAVAVPIWITVFVWQPMNFWLLMTFGTGGLGVVALLLNPRLMGQSLRLRPIDLLLGPATAALLYGVFVVGEVVATWMFSFAEGQIGAVYGIKGGMSPLVIGLLMALFIGPGEELFWRGFLQREWAARHGPWTGYVLGVLAYALIHVVTGNVMLILAAGVCGVLWGFLYMKTGRLWPGIVSHVLWDVSIFLLWPLG